MTDADKTKALEAYALANYEQGGHWVYETHSEEDYLDLLKQANGDLETAKILVKREWEFTCMRERECAWGDGEY